MSINMGIYIYLYMYRFISDVLRRCLLFWINRFWWIFFGWWFFLIDIFIDFFMIRFWKLILESCYENEVLYFKFDFVSVRYDIFGGLRLIMKIDICDFLRLG